jgi:hypothetical protein
MNLHRLYDRISEWCRYPQPNWFQKKLLGMYTDSFDLEFTAKRIASEESAEYMTLHMRDAEMFAVDYDFHEWIGTQVNKSILVNGLVLEFGVAAGRTLNHWARMWPEKTVYGFDGFEGLPEDWGWHLKKGAFSQKKFPSVRKNCELVVGWYNETLPEFVKSHTEPVAFLHVDCDLYSSTKTIFDELAEQIVPGTVIVFDEYFNYPGWQEDEFRAFQEFVKKQQVTYEYIGLCGTHQKVAVRILEKKAKKG